MDRKCFHHPFDPYDIQQQFMEALHECIENGRVGIFESPTGTGKSLSLICGSLTWLREHKRKNFDAALEAIQVEDDEPEWMVQHAREERRKQAHQLRADLEARLEAVRRREKKIRERKVDSQRPLKKRKVENGASAIDVSEDAYLLHDYDSDDDGNDQNNNARIEYSTETTKLMEKLGMLGRHEEGHSQAEDQEELKIFFCSRTHSQLSQFVGELRRVALPPSLPPELDELRGSEAVKHLTLGSRKNLCINSKVRRLENQQAINERCIDLQQSSTPADQRCPFMPNRESEEHILNFRDHALASIRDIEDLASVGRQLQICPYYASRPAIAPAEIVTLPYPLLLQKASREALGISLKGHIVIIDEAHNLLNAVEGIHSAQITSTQLQRSRECLMIYLQKFRNRLKGSNRVYITQLIRVIDSLLLATDSYRNLRGSGGAADSDALLSGKGADQVNLDKLGRYLNESKLARKVDGYIAYLKDPDDQTGQSARPSTVSEVPTLTHVQTFLATLTNPSKEGKLFWAKDDTNIILRYLLLDPSEHFRGIVEDARAVILAGGTMSPMNEYQEQLFPYLVSLDKFSCGHLVPRENLFVRTVVSDESGPLEFNFRSRGDTVNIARLGRLVQDVARLVSGGLVVFFSSYVSLSATVNEWKKSSLLEALHNIKPVYYDERDRHGEDTFSSYCESIRSGQKGAILMSVLGGKLSEGINFSDDLGRCVIVVGMPYPNLETPEWKAKMTYLEDRAAARGEPKGRASREHAENVCMRSVNQAIGRVIRHKDDWASIILVDQRYSKDSIRSKLPGWIRESLNTSTPAASQADSILGDIANFFKRRAG